MQKFIVTAEGRLKYGVVALHKHLLNVGEVCIGGGVYEFDRFTGAMHLSGRSYDFGRVQWSKIDRLILPPELEGATITYEGLPVSEFVKL